MAETVIPNVHRRWNAYGYRSDVDGTEQLALVYGDLSEDDFKDVLTRVHSECLTGDVFGSHRRDRGPQLTRPWPRSPSAAAPSTHLRATRAGASACSPSCRPTSSRAMAST